MTPCGGHGAAGQCQGLRHQETELAVADHEHPIFWADLDLLLDLESGRQRLGEGGVIRRQRVGHGQEVGGREGQVFREAAIAADNAEHGSLAAMRWACRTARRATAAAGVDLTHDPSADERPWAGLDDPDEFVAEHAAKWVVAADQLEIRVANASAQDPDQGFAVRRRGAGQVVPLLQRAVFEPDSDHGSVHRLRVHQPIIAG